MYVAECTVCWDPNEIKSKNNPGTLSALLDAWALVFQGGLQLYVHIIIPCITRGLSHGLCFDLNSIVLLQRVSV